MAHGPAGHLAVVLFQPAVAAAPNEGSATGSITWAGTADGDAPDDIMEGSGTGSITWAGSATGARISLGSATGAISWDGVASGQSSVYPAAVSGRKIVDNNGDVWLGFGLSSWGMAANAPEAEIPGLIADVAALGFTFINVAPCGISKWPGQFENEAGEDFFTGTPFQSSLGPAWDTMDLIMDEALDNNIIVLFSFYTGNTGEGMEDELVAAGTTNARTFGQAIGTRYGGYPNLIWHIGADRAFNYGAGPSEELDALMRGVTETEAIVHLQVAEPVNGATSFDQFIDQEGTSGSGYEWLHLDSNGVYNYGSSANDQFQAVWNESGATTLPVWDCEPPYRGSTHYGTPGSAIAFQELRERNYTTFLLGGWAINYGDEDWLRFGETGWFDGGFEYTDFATLDETIEASWAWGLLSRYCYHPSWAQTSSFVTTGAGSGDTEASAGFNGLAAVAYFPSSRTVQVDTTILDGTGPVSIRWFNPTDNTYTTVTNSEAQQTGRSVTYPSQSSAHSSQGSENDWVLVVELVNNGSATGAISWAGSATGVTDREGAATGAITWAGVAQGTSQHRGAATGAISWAGSAQGVTDKQGAATGAITWDGSAQGINGDTKFNITVIVGPPVLVTRSASHDTVDRQAGANDTVDRVSGVPDIVDRSASHDMVDRDANDPEIDDRSATIALGHGSPDPPTF